MSFNATASDKNNAYVELIWFSGVDDRGKVNYLHFKVKCNFELAPSYYAETTTSRGGFFIFGYDIVNTTIKEVPTFGSLECISAVSDYMIWRAIQLLPPSDLQHVMRIT